ncbi:RNA pyrophosphohydrolase [Methylocella silvestris]|uniref:RNA pyrophosphohydrolase n=1 Tax=Methylocella silvestris TaxID=199596 RepID=UPI0015E0DD04
MSRLRRVVRSEVTQFGNYRPCVGIMLLNRDGLVFVGRRRTKKPLEQPRIGHEWQMPQGGIDPGEDPFQAALREMREETNVASATLLSESPEWYTYDLPDEFSRKSWKGRFHGQRQKWFAFRFEGDESEIDIETPAGGQRPEFDAWRWTPIDQLVDLIIPFKRKVYERVVENFAHLAAPVEASAQSGHGPG